MLPDTNYLTQRYEENHLSDDFSESLLGYIFFLDTSHSICHNVISREILCLGTGPTTNREPPQKRFFIYLFFFYIPP